jgi:hypothetical protein
MLVLDLLYRGRACGELRFACRDGFGKNRVLIGASWKIGGRLLLPVDEVWVLAFDLQMDRRLE